MPSGASKLFTLQRSTKKKISLKQIDAYEYFKVKPCQNKVKIKKFQEKKV